MIWLILCLLAIALVLLAIMGLLLAEREREWRKIEKADHAKCMAHVASVSSRTFAGMLIHNLAVKWESTENMGDLTRIANTRYEIGGPSVVSIWLNEQADQIEAGH